ncbi:universal stress protein [Streptomyces sp. NBC_01410]|uniref:universal stress protein n=1 Tax=Streptomyces sp. NBC_01410 TaxID=2903856 RepID=UPI003253988A
MPDESPVIALARASDRADLLVVGSRGLGGFLGMALGSVSHHLLQLSQCPWQSFGRAPRTLLPGRPGPNDQSPSGNNSCPQSAIPYTPPGMRASGWQPLGTEPTGGGA